MANDLVGFYFSPAEAGPFASSVRAECRRAVIYGLWKGLVIEDKSDPDKFRLLPITLLPSPFPGTLYDRGVDLGRKYNSLYFRVANDHPFLERSLQTLVSLDPFYGRLWEIYQASRSLPNRQSIQLSINRSDYMLPSPTQLRQVEINMIAVSFGGMIESCSDANSFVLQRLNIPESTRKISPRREIALALIEAHNLYLKQNPSRQAVIVLVETEQKYNQVDQYSLEFEVLRLDPRVTLTHATLGEIHSRGRLGEEFELLLDGAEVSLAYFRTGYTTGLMRAEEDWAGRLLLEKSRCVKCPSLNFQLAGTKRVQQLLSDPAVLGGFVDGAAAGVLISSMARQFSPTDPGSEWALGDARDNPGKYVLKSQLEGGGNNLFGSDMVDMIDSGGDCSAFTLMERIYPYSHRNVILRGLGGPFEVRDVVSEYSFFGVVIGDGEEVLKNESFGYIVRSKLESDTEGGITSGSGALSSMYLI